MDSAFKDAIREHLQLKERNRWIEPTMPLSRYRASESESEVDMDLNTGGGDILDPDGPAGWPIAEGLGLEHPDSLWAGLADDGWVETTSSGRRSAA